LRLNLALCKNVCQTPVDKKYSLKCILNSFGGILAAFFRHRQFTFRATVIFPQQEARVLIKELRQNKLLSQEQLAELCGLSLRTIQRVEGGHRIGYASLRALAAEFNINVESLEQELYAMEKISSEYKDLPLWLRLYVGSGWFTASRNEFKKIEVFGIFLSFCFFVFWASNLIFNFSPLPERIPIFGGVCALACAYNISVTIRTADKYDIWSRLESTLPKRFFGLGRKNN
jgi:transcriptional regulator with XRE-family HTH domain